MTKNRNRPTNAAPRPAPPADVIDPNADVDFDQFSSDDDGDEAENAIDDAEIQAALHGGEIAEKPAAGATAAPGPTIAPENETAAPAPRKRPSTDVALRLASEIANEAKRQPLDTAEALIAFHDFILDRVGKAIEGK